MADTARSAQGTLIARAPAATPTVFTTIGNLRNITPPSLSRKEIDLTCHNENEEVFVVGIKRKGQLQFEISWDPAGTTHGGTTGLQKAWSDGSCDVYRVTYPNGTKWTFSGYVTNIGPSAPVDDGLTASVTIRPTYALVEEA